MSDLAELLQPFNYVVMRNWILLPRLDEQHPDLDLFTTDEEANNLRLVTKSLGFVDVRSPQDNYFPPPISALMLMDRKPYKGFFIPSPMAYFLSLYYHAKVHKEQDHYENELVRTFLELFPPVECTDKGVGHYIDRYYNAL